MVQDYDRSNYLKNSILSDIESTRPCQLLFIGTAGLVSTDELKRLCSDLQEARKRLVAHNREIIGEHKQECWDAIKKMREVHDAWWDSFKEQMAQRREDWRARVRVTLEKNYEILNSAINGLERLRANAVKLHEQIASSWSDDFRERAEGWLAETETNIQNKEDFIRKVEKWISDGENKLNS
jgi:glutamyl-tRNA reductase